nr:GNAT family N-acetyltransferase [Nocardia australiensis]
MSGNHGPWAAITDGDRAVSLAHCARLTDRAAEVGVETNEAHRGCGLAATAVNAWADQLAARDLILFYSADEDNIASHRVAQKCKATPLGHLIHITPAVTAD